MSKKYDFSGKIALVTGSSAGIGAAIAIEFAEYGAKLTIHGRDPEALEQIAQRIRAVSGQEPLKIVGDLLDQTVPVRLINETLAKYGRLDILVNNAGAGFINDSLNNENLLEEYDKLTNLLVRVPLKLTQLAMGHLEKTGGNIINISSNASVEPFLFIYSVAKAALDMLTKGCAAQLAPKGIRVNSINPGPTITSIGRSIGADAEHFKRSRETMGQLTAIGRMARPEDMAHLASFLASEDESGNITGAIIINDGGMLVKKRIRFSEQS